ncbi:MAG: alpha-amylase, partial [Tissierellia bacterium]|nr:alpha-amylase [Tissierellia bacterium]
MEKLIMFEAFTCTIKDDGNYYNNMRNNAKELKDAGFGAIWLPPVFKAIGR